MADTRDQGYGYGGLHSTVYEAIHYLNNLQPADLKEIAEQDRICAICNGCHSDGEEEKTSHRLVQLPACKHFFGRSCLVKWLNPLDNERDAKYEGFRFWSEFFTEARHYRLNGDRTYLAAWCDPPRAAGPQSTPINPLMNPRINPREAVFIPRATRVPATSQAGGGYLTTPSRPTTGAVLRALRAELAPPMTVYRTAPACNTPPVTEDLSGVIASELLPGNNTCPLCRRQLFPKPACGESMRFLRVNLRLWDFAYLKLDIRRKLIEEKYRHECLKFMRLWEGDLKAGGESQRKYSRIECQWILMNASSTLTATTDNPDIYRRLVRNWTPKERVGFEDITRNLSLRRECLTYYFGPKTDSRADAGSPWGSLFARGKPGGAAR
ncbi:MAG: hypothetical protein Q9208_007814 [Pyrenodesmia sp. 3 TL-2023]